MRYLLVILFIGAIIKTVRPDEVKPKLNLKTYTVVTDSVRTDTTRSVKPGADKTGYIKEK